MISLSALALLVYVAGIPVGARLLWYHDAWMTREDCVLAALLWPVLCVLSVPVLGLKFLAWLILPAYEDRP